MAKNESFVLRWFKANRWARYGLIAVVIGSIALSIYNLYWYLFQ